MRITYIIGNGFDQAAGLKTSYRHFYTSLLRSEPAYTTFEEVASKRLIRESIRKDRAGAKELWKDFELGLGAFSQFFHSSEINNTLARHAIYCPQLAEKAKEIFLNGCKYATGELRRYLQVIDNTSQNWSLSDSGEKKFIEWITALTARLNETDKGEVEGILAAYKGDEWDICFISLNYTGLLSRCIQSLDAKFLLPTHQRFFCSPIKCKFDADTILMHGSINNFVCGVGTNSQIINTEFRRSEITSRVVKHVLDQRNGNRYAAVKRKISSSQVIVAFGTSFGESDAILCRMIGEWLKAAPDHRLLIYYFTSEDYEDIPTRVDIETKERKRFCRVAGIRNLYANQVHIMPFHDGELVNHDWFDT